MARSVVFGRVAPRRCPHKMAQLTSVGSCSRALKAHHVLPQIVTHHHHNPTSPEAIHLRNPCHQMLRLRGEGSYCSQPLVHHLLTPLECDSRGRGEAAHPAASGPSP